jgi:AAA+ ATPase superfamily predicted ATPase
MKHYFVGRQKELASLNRLLEKSTSNLVVTRGRRRIGKSQLTKAFAKKHTLLSFAGLAPTPTTSAQS